MQDATACACHRSVGVVTALFASLAVLALVAQEACLEGGGRTSDAAWVCEVAAGGSVSVWSFVSPGAVALVALGVGIPVYLLANALGGRLLAARGRRGGGPAA